MKMEPYLKYLLRFNHLYKKKSWKREEFKIYCTLEENFIKMSSYLCLVWWQSKLLSSSLVLQWWLSEPFFLPVTLSFDKFLQLLAGFSSVQKKRKLFCVFAKEFNKAYFLSYVILWKYLLRPSRGTKTILIWFKHF